MKWLLRIICEFKGHVPEPFITENDFRICTKRCKRCKSPLGVGHWKCIPKPPFTGDQEWAMYLEEKNQEIRNSV